MRSRVGALLLCLVLGTLTSLLLAAGSASADPCVLGTICPTPSPTDTPPPTRSPTPAPTHTSTRQPTATKSPTRSPRPTSSRTHTSSPTPSALATTDAPTDPPASAQPVTVKPSGSGSKSGGGIDKLVALILGGAVLLGVGGVSGLYLTRSSDER